MPSHHSIERKLNKKHQSYTNLRRHIEMLSANRGQGLMAEFEALSDFQDALNRDSSLWRSACHPLNHGRNRYGDILANEPTRVKLCTKVGNSDYINANRIDERYILAQAPTPGTVEHWWMMVWQEKVNFIIMLSNVVEGGRVKGHRYWPETPGAQAATKFGSFAVTLVEEEKAQGCSDLMRRLLFVEREGPEEGRLITQYQYVGWPDHGTPKYTYQLNHLLCLMDSHECTGPFLVHCSAGVGRTGVLVTAHVVLTGLKAHLQKHGGNQPEYEFNIVSTLCRLRRCRNHLIQTPNQLLFCYLLILHNAERLIGQPFLSSLPDGGPLQPSPSPGPRITSPSANITGLSQSTPTRSSSESSKSEHGGSSQTSSPVPTTSPSGACSPTSVCPEDSVSDPADDGPDVARPLLMAEEATPSSPVCKSPSLCQPQTPTACTAPAASPANDVPSPPLSSESSPKPCHDVSEENAT